MPPFNSDRLTLPSLFETTCWRKDLSAMPSTLQPWLGDMGSLTARLRAACRFDFKVQVLHHEFVLPPEAAKQALELDACERVLHREVLLCDGAVPLVFACSLLPESALVGAYAELRHLGSRPLGHWLFSEPVLGRSEMEFSTYQITVLPKACFQFEGASNSDFIIGKVSARKTYFVGALKPFLVSEFFLPAILNAN